DVKNQVKIYFANAKQVLSLSIVLQLVNEQHLETVLYKNLFYTATVATSILYHIFYYNLNGIAFSHEAKLKINPVYLYFHLIIIAEMLFDGFYNRLVA